MLNTYNSTLFYHNIDNPLSETKVRVIDKDVNSTSDVLLIIDTSLIIDSLRYELKNKLISAVHQNNEKVIYVNNNSSLRAFYKLIRQWQIQLTYNEKTLFLSLQLSFKEFLQISFFIQLVFSLMFFIMLLVSVIEDCLIEILKNIKLNIQYLLK